MQDNWSTLAGTTLLALHVFGLQVDENTKKMTRCDLAARSKLNNDDSLDEVLEVLGLIINFLTFYLSNSKYEIGQTTQ